MASTLYHTLARNTSQDTAGWEVHDGDAALYPQGPATGARKRWEVLRYEEQALHRFATIDTALAWLNQQEDEGGPTHSKLLWYGIRVGRVPKRFQSAMQRVWLRPVARG